MVFVCLGVGDALAPEPHSTELDRRKRRAHLVGKPKTERSCVLKTSVVLHNSDRTRHSLLARLRCCNLVKCLSSWSYRTMTLGTCPCLAMWASTASLISWSTSQRRRASASTSSAWVSHLVPLSGQLVPKSAKISTN